MDKKERIKLVRKLRRENPDKGVCSKCCSIVEPDMMSTNGRCKECRRDRMAKYRKTPAGQKAQKEYCSRPEIKEKVSAYQAEYRKENREKALAYQAEYFKKPEVKERRNEYNREYCRNRRETDEMFKLKHNLRSRLRSAIQTIGAKKQYRTLKYLGCSIEEFSWRMEALWRDGMSWDNYGTEWHIDHIIPLAAAKNEEEIRLLFHYSNTQPLWAEENLSKNDSHIPEAADEIKEIIAAIKKKSKKTQ